MYNIKHRFNEKNHLSIFMKSSMNMTIELEKNDIHTVIQNVYL